MRRSILGLMSAAALAALGIFALVGPASGAPGTNGSNAQSNSVKTVTHDCTDTGNGGGMSMDDMDGDHDTIAFSGPTVLWPPNHKYRTVTITATDGDSGLVPEVGSEAVTLNTMTTSNQPELGVGSGHTLNDANPAVGNASGDGSATQTIQLRGERAGKDPTKAGRTYTIQAMATYDGSMMEHCSATFTVTVPHDMGNRH
jgi:hypothetical protein